MAKKKKDIRPFFELRFDVNDTLEALARELLMTIQAIDTAIDHGGMNEAAKNILGERRDALKAICLSNNES